MADYVTRMIEGLARALARVGERRRAGQLAEAEAELASLGMQVAGVDMNMLAVLGAPAIAAQLGDPRQLEALAKICEERAEVQAARGDVAGAERWRAQAAVFRERSS